jgi:hypothetical protein
MPSSKTSAIIVRKIIFKNFFYLYFLNSVTSPQCTDAGCTVTRGGAITGTAVFTPTAAHQTIELFIRVQPTPGGAWMDIPITTPGASNACNSMTPGCPTTANVPQTLNLNLLVPNETPLFVNANLESKFKF